MGYKSMGLQRVRDDRATNTFNLQSKKDQKDLGISSPHGTHFKCSAVHTSPNSRGCSSYPESPATSSSQAK